MARDPGGQGLPPPCPHPRPGTHTDFWQCRGTGEQQNPSSAQTRKALGSTGVEKEVRGRAPPIHKHRFSTAKALRTNPENSVKAGALRPALGEQVRSPPLL